MTDPSSGVTTLLGALPLTGLDAALTGGVAVVLLALVAGMRALTPRSTTGAPTRRRKRQRSRSDAVALATAVASR